MHRPVRLRAGVFVDPILSKAADFIDAGRIRPPFVDQQLGGDHCRRLIKCCASYPEITAAGAVAIMVGAFIPELLPIIVEGVGRQNRRGEIALRRRQVGAPPRWIVKNRIDEIENAPDHLAGVQDDAIGNFTGGIAATCELTATVAVADQTAGKLVLFVEYIVVE